MNSKFFVFSVVCLFIALSSCTNNSDWGKVTITANESLAFSSSTNSPVDMLGKDILVKVGEEVMKISNRNLVYKVCYLKTAFPDQDIVIDYVKIKEDGKEKLDPRFINLVQ